jgi:hypothetical protein
MLIVSPMILLSLYNLFKVPISHRMVLKINTTMRCLLLLL